MSPADLVECMIAQTSVEDWLRFLHPDAEYQPLPGAPVYRGLAEIREWAEGELADPARPEPLPVSVTEVDEKAVVRGQVRFAGGSGERRHHVLEVAAWVVTFSDGKLRRVEAFSKWGDAEAAAGITGDERGAARRLGPGFSLLLRRLLPARSLVPAR